MILCVRLIEKIQDEYYSSEPHSYRNTKLYFDKIEDKPYLSQLRVEELSEDFDSYFAKYPLEYKRVINADKCPFNRDSKDGIAYAMGRNIHNKAIRILFRTLENNIERWWD